MPRPVAWLLTALWLAAVVPLASHARRAGWGPAEALLAGLGWLLVPTLLLPGEVRRLFGPVFAYEVLRIGRRPLTFALRGLYVLLVMALLVWVYLVWLEDVRDDFRPTGVRWPEVLVLAVSVLGAFVAVRVLAGWWRWVTVVGLGVLAGVALFADVGGTSRPVPPEKLSAFATEFFHVFVGLQFGVVALLTPAYVAGTVADEKERKTLEFLLATDLAPREILLGKLAARVVSLLMFVLAGLPVVAFLQLFGGIDPDLLLTVTAAAAVQVLGFSAVSVYLSTVTRRPRDAIALAYLLLLMYLLGSLAAAAWLTAFTLAFARRGPWVESLLGFEIDMQPVFEALAAGANVVAMGNPAWHTVLLVEPITGTGGLTPTNMALALGRFALFWVAVGGLLMAYAVWKLRPIALGHKRAPTQKVIDRQARRRPAVGPDPMLWKEVFLEGGFKGGCVGWLAGLAVMGLVFVWPPVMVYFNFIDTSGRLAQPSAAKRWEEFARELNVWCRVATGGLGTVLLIAAAVRGAGAVSGERDRDTWITLMSTPLGAWEMLRGKWLGTMLGVRRGVAALLAVWAIALCGRAVEPVMVVLAAGVFAVYLAAFAWVGILCSVTARTTLIATVRAVAAGLTLAGGWWLAFGLCCVAPLAALTGGRAGRDFASLANLLLGFTPPIVLGWLPLRTFDRWELEPFRDNSDSAGIIAPVLGTVCWAALAVVLGWYSFAAFERASNRADQPRASANPTA
jgi:ABC-type transport system involved in multi-copper enzyme maturation permease subunit